jgi:hypothetical protein
VAERPLEDMLPGIDVKMRKQHVALFCPESLLGESLEHLLGKLADVEILGPWVIDESSVGHLDLELPDIVVITGEKIGDNVSTDQSAALLTVQILEKFDGLPVVQVLLEQNQVRIYNSHSIPASSSHLIEAIRGLRNKDN